MSKRNNIAFIKPDEPAFIKRLKASAGYVEGPDVDTKRTALSFDEREERDDADDEKPLVVVLKSGDLTAEEVEVLAKTDEPKEDEVPGDGRILFKKPNKNKIEVSTSNLQASTVSPKSTNESETSSKISKEKPPRKHAKPRKSLLSFNDEDEES